MSNTEIEEHSLSLYQSVRFDRYFELKNLMGFKNAVFKRCLGVLTCSQGCEQSSSFWKEGSAGSDEIKLLKNVEEALLMLSYAHIFVGCLSEAGDLLSQWRGYCPATNGFSIGFDPWHLHSALARQGFVLAPCIYDEQKQEVLVKELLGDALHFPETLPENVFSPKRMTVMWRPQRMRHPAQNFLSSLGGLKGPLFYQFSALKRGELREFAVVVRTP